MKKFIKIFFLFITSVAFCNIKAADVANIDADFQIAHANKYFSKLKDISFAEIVKTQEGINCLINVAKFINCKYQFYSNNNNCESQIKEILNDFAMLKSNLSKLNDKQYFYKEFFDNFFKFFEKLERKINKIFAQDLNKKADDKTKNDIVFVFQIYNNLYNFLKEIGTDIKPLIDAATLALNDFEPDKDYEEDFEYPEDFEPESSQKDATVEKYVPEEIEES